MFTKLFKQAATQFFKHQKLIFYVLLLLLLFLALFPRLIVLLNQNPVFGFDQGRDYLAVKSIIVDHKLTLIGEELGAGAAGISGIFQGPFYYYLLTIPFILFNGNPVGGVYVMIALSLLTILAGYYLGNKCFGRWGGLLTGLLIAISPILIGEAKFIWNPHCPPFFILLTFIFLYLFMIKKKGLFIFLTAFFAGFIYNFEIAVSVPVSLTLVIFSIFLFGKSLKYYFYLLLGLLLAYSPAMLFEVRHHFMAMHSFAAYLTNHNQLGNIPNSFYVVNHLRAFVDIFSESLQITNFDVALFCLLAVILLSVFLLLKEKNQSLKKMVIFMLLLIPVNYVVFYFLKNWLWTYYLTDLTIAYIFLLSYIIYTFCKRKYYKSSALLLLVVGFLVLVGLVNSIQTSIHDYSDYGGTAKLKGKEDAIDYIYKQAKGKPFGMFVFSPPIYTYPYDYLIWWYGERKYGYVPYAEKKDRSFYLSKKIHISPGLIRGGCKQ